jgi:drug/metabolite transporter (DMT)-like permease
LRVKGGDPFRHRPSARGYQFCYTRGSSGPQPARALRVSRKLKADLLLALCALIWGTTFVVVKDALADASVFVFLSLRFVLASALLLMLYRRELRKLDAGAFRAGALIGYLMFGGYAFQTAGLTLTTPSKSAFITGFFVVLVPLFLAGFGRRQISRWIWAGVAAAVAGLYFLSVPPSGFSDLNIGDVLTLFCAALYALHIIAIGHYAPRHSGGVLVFLQVTTTAVLSMAAVPVFALLAWEAPRVAWTPGLIWAVLVTGVLATVFTFSAQVWAQRYASPSHAALLGTLEPVFAGLTSYVFAGERMGWRGLAGAGLILAGILVAELKGPAPVVESA